MFSAAVKVWRTGTGQNVVLRLFTGKSVNGKGWFDLATSLEVDKRHNSEVVPCAEQMIVQVSEPCDVQIQIEMSLAIMRRRILVKVLTSPHLTHSLQAESIPRWTKYLAPCNASLMNVTSEGF